MQIGNLPTRFPLIWGSGAGSSYINNIPTASQIGVTPGRASLTDGFPPVTFSPTGSGGTPPFGGDFNGILRWLSQWAQWIPTGAWPIWDSTFSASIGGYPKTAIVTKAQYLLNTGPWGLWLNTVDSNTTNPDAGGAGWVDITPLLVSATAGGDLTGSYPNPSLAAISGVAGTYGFPQSVTVDTKGRVTAIQAGEQQRLFTVTLPTSGAPVANGTYTIPNAFPSSCDYAFCTAMDKCNTTQGGNPIIRAIPESASTIFIEADTNGGIYSPELFINQAIRVQVLAFGH